ASRIKRDARGLYTISYIHANQPIPQRDNPPWEYSDIEQDLILLAQPLPARYGAIHTLTVEQPIISLHGTWALVTQHLFYI
ncbi:MAG: hypothetical protein NT075_26300, partial [Chloroflexi bacterium]|nr:hypothetical protein [Chloroflexota bacterium]